MMASVQAQMFSVGGQNSGAKSVRSAMATVQLVDFTTHDSGKSTTLFDGAYLYGASLSDDHLLLRAGFGTQNTTTIERRLFDVYLMSWRGVPLTRSPKVQLELPLAVGGTFKKLSQKLLSSNFESVVTIGTPAAGTGLALTLNPNQHVSLHLHGIGNVGFTFLNDGGRGVALLSDVSAELRLIEVFGRFGLTLGYDFQTQESRPNYNSSWISNLKGEFQQNTVHHAFRIGLNF